MQVRKRAVIGIGLGFEAVLDEVRGIDLVVLLETMIWSEEKKRVWTVHPRIGFEIQTSRIPGQDPFLQHIRG